MRRSVAALLVTSALAWLFLAAPVAAFPLTNCSLNATALAADGSTIDSIQSGAVDATQDDPFLVDWDGTISYEGMSDIAMVDNSWGVSVFLFPTPLQGGDDNPEDNRTGSGSVGVSANAPFRFTGLYFVHGSLTGSGGTCEGSGWFKLTGDPIGTIPFFGGVGILILGLIMLAIGSQGHLITAIVGGILAGVGGATLLVLYSTLPFAELTPLIVLLLGLLVGVVIGLIARRGTGNATDEPAVPPTA